MEGTKKKIMSFHQYSWNSEVGTTWISLICWHQKTSNRYVLEKEYYVISRNFFDEIHITDLAENLFKNYLVHLKFDMKFTNIYNPTAFANFIIIGNLLTLKNIKFSGFILKHFWLSVKSVRLKLSCKSNTIF